MIRRRRWRLALGVLLAAAALALMALARYGRSAAFVVRAADLHGLSRALADRAAYPVTEDDVTVPCRHRPLRGRLFRPAASGGRAIVGVAPGWTKEEFDVMRLDHSRRTSRFVEGVALIKRLFTEQNVTFEGRHFQVSKLTLALRPTRKPRPPMWLGGSVESAVRRIATIAEPELGDTWVASSHLKTPVIIEQARVFKATLKELGKPAPADFPVLRNIVVAPDRQTAIRDAGPAIAESYKIFGKWGLFTEVVGDAKAEPEFEDLLRDRFIVGSPEECAEQIVDLLRATGCTRLVTRLQWVGMQHRHVIRTIELIGDKVAPLVRKALA